MRDLLNKFGVFSFQLSHDNLPVIERKKGPGKATPKERKEFNELFDTDSGDDSDEEDDKTRYND